MAVALRSEKRSGSAKALPDHFMPRIRRGFPVIRPGTARLHPKGTSSRFALRAPRRFAPHNDKSGVITVLTGACTSRQRCAGSGMPLPYNSGCGRRNCFKICNCQWRSVSAATDAIGLCVFAGSPFESAAVRRAGLSPPIQHLTILRRHYFTYAARNCRVCKIMAP